MNLDLEGYFCPDCGHRVTVSRQDDPMRGTIQFRVAFHHLRYVFEMSAVEWYSHNLVDVVHHRIRAAIEEIRAKAHPVGQVSYDGILPEGVQFVRLPVYSSYQGVAFGVAQENCPAGSLVAIKYSPSPPTPHKPPYPPARKILL